VQLEGVDKGLEQARVCEDGQDILEEDAGRREVGELAQRGLELYFKMGEFGGGGGTGGGESSLGGIALEGGVWLAGGRVGSGGLACDGRIGGRRGVDGVALVSGRIVGGRHGGRGQRAGYMGRRGAGRRKAGENIAWIAQVDARKAAARGPG